MCPVCERSRADHAVGCRYERTVDAALVDFAAARERYWSAVVIGSAEQIARVATVISSRTRS